MFNKVVPETLSVINTFFSFSDLIRTTQHFKCCMQTCKVYLILDNLMLHLNYAHLLFSGPFTHALTVQTVRQLPGRSD